MTTVVVSPCKQPVVEGILGKLAIYSISLIRISISLAYQAESWKKEGEREREREKQSKSFFPPLSTASTMRSIENEEVIQTGRYITFMCISWWEQWFISGFSHRGRRWGEGEKRESGKVFSFLYTCDFWSSYFSLIQLLASTMAK